MELCTSPHASHGTDSLACRVAATHYTLLNTIKKAWDTNGESLKLSYYGMIQCLTLWCQNQKPDEMCSRPEIKSGLHDSSYNFCLVFHVSHCVMGVPYFRRQRVNAIFLNIVHGPTPYIQTTNCRWVLFPFPDVQNAKKLLYVLTHCHSPSCTLNQGK